MRACIDCGRPTERTRCPDCESGRTKRRKAEGKTGERGSTYAGRRRREHVLARDRHACRYCGAPASIEDHYVPKAAGGTDDEANLVAACGPCNSKKSDRDPDEFLSSTWLADRIREVRAIYAGQTAPKGNK